MINKKIKFKKGIYFLLSEQETKLSLAPADIETKLNIIIPNKISIREHNDFELSSTKRINLINILPNQIISLGTSLIPFLEHNDANRALMGSNMQRQAVTLKKKEKAIVRTGIESIIAHDTESTITAINSGFIKYLSLKKLILHQKINNLNKEKINFSLAKKICSKNLLQKKYKNYSEKVYFLRKGKYSNQNTYILQFPSVKKNTWIKKGQILAEGSGIYQGELALGKNLLIGYLPWEGYNFEDAIIISEKLVKENLFNSIHIKKYKTFLINNETGEVRIKKVKK